MGTLHDPASQSLAAASVLARSPGRPPEEVVADAAPSAAPDKDVLSDVLRVVKLTGALFFWVDASSPWSVEVPRADSFAHLILPHAQHVISYHIITQGSGSVSIGDDPPMEFAEGDILVIPHEDSYAMCSAPGVRSGLSPEDSLDFFRAMAAGQLPFVVNEGGGGHLLTRYVCGFLGCDARPFNPLLGALPPLIRIRRAAGAPSDLLDRLIELTLAEVSVQRPGAECIRLRLSELMFVEVVRRYIEALPPEQTGWLAGLRDPAVGRAVALVHENPARGWTIEELARETGVSRSVLAARFTRLVGCPPMQYLTRWRVQLAARLLTDGLAKVSAVGRDVGYESEAAFSRSFKKLAGVSPAGWRDGRRG
ncbi:AraC family transcriptional regulator [Mesorhizobium sp.]|uniref:AraC family transcriptional regulator n=1 Tax=Mesorhizobium sp. TaxID=1871066 RepID=UPI000FE5ABAB|nr:AraC family transcriptional regulator [Mesorhizobium sp.]RWP26950.1 MAG: AraC family transcriptional regulator [Mesorhizobium sp.]